MDFPLAYSVLFCTSIISTIWADSHAKALYISFFRILLFISVPFLKRGTNRPSTCFALPLLALFIICSLVRSYSNSSFRSFSLLSSTSTGPIRIFPLLFGLPWLQDIDCQPSFQETLRLLVLILMVQLLLPLLL